MMTDITGMTHKIVKIFAVSLALIFVAVALTASMPQGTAQANPQVLAQAVVNPLQGQPVVSENTNITWSSFNQSMAPNEYLNSTGHPEYINAEPSLYYKNYISVNPSHIIAPNVLQNDAIGNSNINWGHPTNWGSLSGTIETNMSYNVGYANESGEPMIRYTVQVSGGHVGYITAIGLIISSANFSSQNPAYDYLTAAFTVNTPSDSGAVGYMMVRNQTYPPNVPITPSIESGSYYITESLLQIEKNSGYATTFNTTAGSGYTSQLFIEPALNIPSGAPAGIYSITVNGLSMTTYPITFGSNATGTTLTQSLGNLRLAEFHPDNINNVTVVGDGYSEALSMPTQMSSNYTQTQNQLTGSSYIEETTSQGSLLYPTGTDISYSGSNVSVQFNGISGSQIPLLNVNGVSYSTQISNVSGNSTTLITTNPNQPVSVIYQVQYTASQWNSFTAPPFILSVQGIEYYWWIGLIAIFGGLGIFAGLRSYATGKEENLRAPPKVR